MIWRNASASPRVRASKLVYQTDEGAGISLDGTPALASRRGFTTTGFAPPLRSIGCFDGNPVRSEATMRWRRLPVMRKRRCVDDEPFGKRSGWRDIVPVLLRRCGPENREQVL